MSETVQRNLADFFAPTTPRLRWDRGFLLRNRDPTAVSRQEKDPAAGGPDRVFPSRALRRHRDSLLRRLFGVRGAIVVKHGEFVERVLSTQNGVHLVFVDRLGPRADEH